MPTTPPPLRGRTAAPPDALPPVPALLAESDFSIESRLNEADPPFRTPASWRSTPLAQRPDRQWHWSERTTAAFLGFAAGILVIVPTVIFLSSSEPDRVQPARSIEAAAPSSPVEAVAVAGISTGSWLNTAPAAVIPASESSGPRDHDLAARSAERARAAMAEGRVADARDVLRSAASPDAPRLWFALAETYDPLVASNGHDRAANAGASENLKTADIRFARYYYQQALTYGVSEARERLDALKQR